MLSRPLVFNGQQLRINFSTSTAGSIRVEIQDSEGKPLEGFALSDSTEIFGDAIDYPVSWRGGSSVQKLVGQTVRLRFVLRDADLFSLRFANEKPTEQPSK